MKVNPCALSNDVLHFRFHRIEIVQHVMVGCKLIRTWHLLQWPQSRTKPTFAILLIFVLGGLLYLLLNLAESVSMSQLEPRGAPLKGFNHSLIVTDCVAKLHAGLLTQFRTIDSCNLLS